MAEADITALGVLGNGSTPYGDTIRGAMVTLQTRVKPDLLATYTVTGLVELATNTETATGSDSTRAVTPAGLTARINTAAETMVVGTHAAPGAYNIGWAAGSFFRANASANITSLTESGAPVGATIRRGILEIINTSGGSITVDTTGLAYGITEVLTIPASGRELLYINSTGA